MKSSEAAIIRDGIESVELKGKKKVKITCKNNSSGVEVNKIIAENFATLSAGGDLKLTSSGFSYKDFTIKTDSSESAEALHDNLNSIINNKPGAPGGYEPGNPGGNEPGGNEPEVSKFLPIIAGLIILIAIGVVVWMKRR